MKSIELTKPIYEDYGNFQLLNETGIIRVLMKK